MRLPWLLLCAPASAGAAPPATGTPEAALPFGDPVPAPVVGLPSAARLMGGETATCAEDFAGAKWCWGNGAAEPRQVSLDPGVRSAARAFPECTLAARTLTCELPDGAWTVAAPPVHAVAMAADPRGTVCVADGQGPTWCLFDLGEGGRTPWRRLPGLEAAVELAPLAAGICGRDGDGDVACWTDTRVVDGVLDGGGSDGGASGGGGSGEHAETTAPERPFGPRARRVEGFGRPTALTSGRDLLCGRGADGAVRCRGRLGAAGEWLAADRPVEIRGLRDASVLHASHSHVCGVVAGEVRCFGDGHAGQLGPGRLGSEEPVTISLPGPAIDVAAGRDHTCALLRSGEVLCWGGDALGQLGRGSAGARTGGRPPVAGTPEPPAPPPPATPPD